MHGTLIIAIVLVSAVAGLFFVWRRRGRKSSELAVSNNQAVILHFKLPLLYSGRLLSEDDIHSLENEIGHVVVADNSGAFDGDEFSDGKCILYFCGPNAQLLWKSVRTMLDRIQRERHLTYAKGSAVELRFGPPGSPSQKMPIV